MALEEGQMVVNSSQDGGAKATWVGSRGTVREVCGSLFVASRAGRRWTAPAATRRGSGGGVAHMTITTVRRLGVVTAGAAAAVAVTAASASAHHCFIPMHSLDGPTSSNWFVISAEMGAGFEGYAAACDGARDAGYAALRDAGLPVALKVFEKMTIGDPKGVERIPNPNGADGKGLEYFGAGSTLPEEMVATYVAGADAYDC